VVGETPGDYHLLLQGFVETEVLYFLDGRQEFIQLAPVHRFLEFCARQGRINYINKSSK